MKKAKMRQQDQNQEGTLSDDSARIGLGNTHLCQVLPKITMLLINSSAKVIHVVLWYENRAKNMLIQIQATLHIMNLLNQLKTLLNKSESNVSTALP